MWRKAACRLIADTGQVTDNALVAVDGTAVAVQPDGTFSHGPVALTEGSQLFRIVATDRVGNRTEVTRTVIRDTVAPVLSIAAPTAGEFFDLAGDPVGLAWQESGSGVDVGSIALLLNGSPVVAACSPVGGGASCLVADPPGGPVTLQATALDRAGNPSEPATVAFVSTVGGDFVPPAIALTSPPPGAVLNVAAQVLRGRVSEAATLTLDGSSVALAGDLTFAVPVTLAEGASSFHFEATDSAANVGTLDVTLTLDTSAPAPPVDGLVTVSEVGPALYQVSGSDGAVSPAEPGQVVVARLPATGASWALAVTPAGGFSGDLTGLPGDRLTLLVRDAAGNESAAIERTLAGSLPIPPDPAAVAPSLDPSVPAGLCASTAFLWSGAQKVQFGVGPGGIDCERLAIVRGRVVDGAGAPLAGVAVRAVAHPDLGLTLTRADGAYDLAVRGGGPVTLDFQRAGYLPSRRTRSVGWEEWVTWPEVALIEPDSAAATIDLSAATPIQTARGALVTDADGSRRATLLFAQGTSAEAVLADGSRQPLPALSVRATEYSVGPQGPIALPAELPPGMAYAYAVELSVDEAEAAGAAAVEFSQPVAFYLEDFLGVPVGLPVPAASLDQSNGTWRPEPNGLVVGILAEDGGLAALDLTGSGQPASAGELAASGISDAERGELAALYEPGQALLRLPVSHFSPWAVGWPWGLVTGALAPPPTLPEAGDADDLDRPTVSRFAGAIETENQVLGQALDLVGVPFGLHYRSDRVPGRKAPYVLSIPVTGDTPPAELAGVEVAVEIAGQRIAQAYSPLPGQTARIEWDGRDRFGRPVTGRVPWTAEVTYVYPGRYRLPDTGNPAWGFAGGLRMESAPVRDGLRLSRQSGGSMGGFQVAPAFGLGGWSLAIHHVLDVDQATLFFGDGRRRHLGDERQRAGVLTRVAGTGTAGFSGDGAEARQAQLAAPQGLSVTADGSLLVADTGTCRIRRIDPDGIITTVAGSGCGAPGEPVGDGGPAVLARLSVPKKALEGPDGAVYIADTGNHRIRRVAPDGTIETVAGTGEIGCAGLGGPATAAELENPQDLAFDGEGNLLVSTFEVNVGFNLVCRGVYRLDRRGTLSRIVDNPYQQTEGGGPGLSGSLRQPMGLAVGGDGSVFFSDANQVSRRPAEGLTSDGTSWNLAGLARFYLGSDEKFAGDGLPASTSTRFDRPVGLAVSRTGAVYVADYLNRRIRRIGGDGVVATVAGGGASFPGDGFPAADAALAGPWGVTLEPSGRALFFTDTLLHQVWKLSLPSIEENGEELWVPSEDGALLYVFDREGRHLRTEDSVTRQAVWSFRTTTYSTPEGGTKKLLTEVEDAFGNVVTLERDLGGQATAVVSPFGQRTELTMHPTTGFLREVRRDLTFGTERVELTTDAGGLLRQVKTPEGQLYDYLYDLEGRLTRVDDPAQGSLTLDFLKTVTGHRVALTTAEGLSRSVEVAFEPGGGIRQVATLPSGLVVEAELGRDERTTWTYPDDTIVTATTKPEPRLGALARVASGSRIETPVDHRERVVERERTVAVLASDPLGLGRQTDTVRVNGRESVSTYLRSTRTLTSTSPEGRTGETVFDVLGRVVEVREPGIDPVRFAYDARGRLSEVRQGTGAAERTATVTYGPDGFVETVTDPLLQVTRTETDLVGRVTKVILPDLREVRFEYDLNGNLTKLTPPTRPDHRFDHNAVDQVTEYAPPDLDPVTPEVPATTYAYDQDHRLTTVTRPDGQTVIVGYDTAGRVSTLTHAHGVTTLAYDAETGKVTAVTGPGGATRSFTYDGPWVTSVTVGGPFAATVELEPDTPVPGFPATNFWLGTLRVAGQPATELDFVHDDDGLLTEIRRGPQTVLENFHDPAAGRWLGNHVGETGIRVGRDSFGEPSRLEAGFFGGVSGGSPPFVGTALLDVTYERDRVGRVVRKTETTRATPASSPLTQLFEYDYDEDRGWLTEVKRDGVVIETYAYDANGNRTSWTRGAESGTATHDAQDRLLTAGPFAYTYTANGELLTKAQGAATVSYTYDAFSNLRTVVLPDGITIEYLIDGRNRRIGKKVDGTLIQRFLYLGGLSPIAELDAAGLVTTQYLYGSGGNVPDGFLRGGVLYRIVTDELNSVRFVLDATTGVVAQRMEYDAFGRVTLDTNPGFQPFGFAGGLYDPQTGLVRFGARDYDPEVGRWTTKDPIGFAGGELGLYTYVGNDPVNRVDPSGLQADRYHGMMREFAETPGLVEQHSNSAGWAVAGVAAVAAGFFAVEAVPVVAAFCLQSPGTCQSLAADLLNPNPGDLVPPVGTVAKGAGITAEGISKIERHLSRAELSALDDPPNAAMIERLRTGSADPHDLSFYSHELLEADLMDAGLDARAAHLRTLELQGIAYGPGYESHLYHPDVIREFPEFFNPAAHP